ncbi:glycosyltransferase [Brevibacterium luteolum]|uniref:glycosyltransferase n=1 Tax=Brevibacterium luteolum TaxID=199591 RepID=UPI001C2392D7|nr:heparinase II/III family protein [Brevibacterium luteolum]
MTSSVLAALILGLLTAAAITGSSLLAIVGFVLGLLLILAASVAMLRLISHISSRSDQVLTRTSNLERRTTQLDRRLDDIDSPSGSLTAIQSDLEASQAAVAALEKHAERSQNTLRIIRRRVPAGFLDSVTTDLAKHAEDGKDTRRIAFESAVQLGRRPQSVLSEKQAEELFAEYLRRNEYIQLRPLLENFDLMPKQSLTTLRALYQHFRRTGYWDLAEKTLDHTYRKSSRDTDLKALTKIQREVGLFTDPTATTTDLPAGAAYDPKGPILHIVGRVLPETQTGYTLRTQYTAAAQQRKGLPIIIVGQSGLAEKGAELHRPTRYTFQDIDYYLLPGPAKNDVMIDEWLRANMRALADLVIELRPSILHAQSDFFNALIANTVGRTYGIPVVYESRGFWEESWLSRTITAYNWSDDAPSLFEIYGRPAAYDLRRHAEEVARTLPDHVFTLAEVMRDHILESARGDIPEHNVSIVPNAVQTDNFPVQERDESLACETGLAEGALTIGYISSMVEYEGIDTLIEAFNIARVHVRQPINLLLVGDGDYLPTLRGLVAEKDIPNVIFTGRVPHQDILRYYGLIDIFVVPRKRSTVTDLVTPLKPFEAFSTGRAVILSNVAALQEIADQSGAVETFQADSPADLAKTIALLADDPEKRRYLSERASRWVRNHRTWDANVNEYYRVYRKLGYMGPRSNAIDAELKLEAAGMNPGELVERLSKAAPPPLYGWFALGGSRQSAHSLIRDGWAQPGFPPVALTSKIDWASYGAENRSWGYELNSWQFMEALLSEYDQSEDFRWLSIATDIALDWIEAHFEPGHIEDEMAWYDMAVALRLPRLIALTLRLARTGEHRDSVVIMAQAISTHFDELAKESAFNPGNNHGFYTAASQLHAAKYVSMYPQANGAREQGKHRLAQMAESQFAADGIHKEHSPEYHQMLSRSFEKAIKDGLINDKELSTRLQRAADAMAWMIQPDGTLLQFGDSRALKMVSPTAQSISSTARYILTDGQEGTPPTEEMAIYSEGGYAFVRSPKPSGPGSLKNSGYLAFSAAFHSRAHKHADDLNVVWFDRGVQILTDSGRYGYGKLLDPHSPLRSKGFYYALPERQYVESTQAHNTLSVDGKDHDRRERVPYGSGIAECTAEAGVFDLTGRVHHADYIHRRRLIYRPGEQLVVGDSIFSQAPESREGIIWFNVSDDFDLTAVDDEVRFSSKGAERFDLVIDGPGELIEPLHGSLDPYRGWRSRVDGELAPVWSLGFKIEFVVRTAVRTTLRLEEQ